MTVTRVDTDLEALTVTLVAEFPAPVQRVWQLWADPRQLERWWGPPGCRATVHEHDLVPGGLVTYVMALPGGKESGGWWRVETVDPPSSLSFTDGWAGSDEPTTAIRVLLTEQEGGTRMEIRSTFTSREQMEELVRMGAVEGLKAAVGQIDDLLAA
jgi:uncharacterized protein YndB with AHSA1/START domain